ncbi:MAG: carbon-nitrogen hydrolase family protein [Verrucomicrobiia bacterium]
MNTLQHWGRLFAALVFGLTTQANASSPENPALVPEGWSPASPRDGIRPAFSWKADSGREGGLALSIRHDDREGLDGYWTKVFPVQGGRYHRFQAFRKTEGVPAPRRSAIVRLLWRGENGRGVLRDEPPPGSPNPLATYATGVLEGFTPSAEAEFPADMEPGADGWTEVSQVYRAPSGAQSAIVELHLQWAPGGKVDWSGISLNEVRAPAGRIVRLAAVHFRPREGKTPADKCRLFAPLIAEAANKKADLVVLPETLTFYGTGLSMAECAEPIPGPSTEYFGGLAKQHGLYLVVGLIERDQHLVYNVAVLIGPDGKVAGKYRKICLPRDEVVAGVAPGVEYPVFATRFGKVGMMVCYDGFFPEVARELSNRGAEVIAWPVWGCNPILASARACENHVYVVSSTYEDASRNWMLTAIWDHQGRPTSRAETWGTVAIAEVNLDQRLHWPSLGDFKADLLRHRPLHPSEAK